ncbi:MAG TPA: cupredoxin family copper-binding protein [Aliidongia sp.]|nr:cupredoxin family copper-binding protein [Aliidongia sp.]
MLRFPFLTAAALSFLAAAPVLAAEAGPVTIDNFSFNPPVITIKPGDRIQWVNRDDIPHNVREATGGKFKCGVLDTGEACSVTFTEPGEYKYFCALHPHMTGTVIVKAD